MFKYGGKEQGAVGDGSEFWIRNGNQAKLSWTIHGIYKAEFIPYLSVGLDTHS